MGRLPCVVEVALPVARVLVVRAHARPHGIAARTGGERIAERRRDDGAWTPVPDPAMDLVARRAMRVADDLARRLESAVDVELFLLEDGELRVNAALPEPHPAFGTGVSRAVREG